jgi:deoxycytidylate deaminase
MIVNAGILNVVYRDYYNDELTDTVLYGLLEKFEGDIE